MNDGIALYCIDPTTKKSIKIPTLIPQTNEERVQFELGALNTKNKKISRPEKQFRAGEQLSEGSLQIDKKAAELLVEASPLLCMPSLADSNSTLMSRTEMQNAMIAQPQVCTQKWNHYNYAFDPSHMELTYFYENIICFQGP